MTTRKTTKKPDWERLSKNLVGGFNPNINWRKIDFESTMGINLKLANSEPINWEDEYRKLKAFVPLALAQQRSELLDLVEKEVVGEDEYSAMINGVPAQDMHDDYQNQLRRQQRQKLLALRKEGGEKV